MVLSEGIAVDKYHSCCIENINLNAAHMVFISYLTTTHAVSTAVVKMKSFNLMSVIGSNRAAFYSARELTGTDFKDQHDSCLNHFYQW